MGYYQSAFKGISWVGTFRALMRLTAFIRTAVLARLLTPAQFGIFGIAALVLSLIEMFTETGINVFLIQEKSSTLPKYLNTAFVVSIIRGSFIFCLVLVSAPFIAAFFNQPASIPFIALISVVPLIRGFINPSIVNFQKQLKFNQEFWFRSGITLIDALVAVSIAFIYKSPASLIWGLIAAAVTETALSHLFISPKPRLRFSATQLTAIISQGKWVTSAGIFAFFANKGADIAIGKLLSSTALGFYQMAYRIALVPIEEIMEIFNKVAFPIYVKIAHDRSRLKRAFIKNLAAMTILAAPAMMAVYIFALPITRLFLGNNWLSIIPILKILAIAGMFSVFNAASNPLFLAFKQQRYLSFIIMVSLITLALTVFPLLHLFGLAGAAFALLFSQAFVLPIRLWLVYRLLT